MVLTKNIKEYCADRKNQLKELITNSGKTPKLAIIEVGENEASIRYIRNKIKDCEAIGITAHRYWFNEEISEIDLIEQIQDLTEHYDGIICQLPLPEHINVKHIETAIDPSVDVDGFHPMSKFKPCTPLGIIKYLQCCRYDFCGKNVTIINRSDIVGKPLAHMLTDLDATVTLCHSKTKDLWRHIDMADLIIVAVGKAKFLNCYPIYKPVIDVGINFDENGKMCGDCFNIEDRDVTPVPGGVGLLTRVALLENVCAAAGLNVEEVPE